MQVKIRMLAGLAMVSLVAAACGGGPASGSGASVVEDVDATADVDGETADADIDDAAEIDDESEAVDPDTANDADADANDAELGTRDNPLAIGTQIEMGDWNLAVVSVDLDATEAVLAENSFNDPPAEGRQFVMFGVEATYIGEDSGNAWIDFNWAVVGSAGNTFGSSMDDSCGVIPDPLDDTGETFPGGQVRGNECVAVDADQISGGTIRIEEFLSFDDTRAFYALD